VVGRHRHAKGGTMKITKYTHACVRIEHDGAVLVIDPGTWSEPAALDGADAILVTHEHADHVDRLRLTALGAPVFAPVGADLGGLPFTGMEAGQDFVAGGVPVSAFGGRHATIYGGEPDCPNLGYLVAGSVYHPGDSVSVPGRPVETLLVPAQGSWLKMCEAIDFVRTVKPQRAFPIHDAQLNERGLDSVNGWLGETSDTDYRYLAPGQSA
jgi:L-ascorbate metabolism protein UlaG (beta-lactamase superfamily)